MNIILIDNHAGEGVFPVFKKGTKVDSIKKSDESEYWLQCSINSIQTYIPESYITQGKLNTNYNPTELIANKGDIFKLLKIVHEWLYVENKHGETGWVPACKVMSINN